MNKKDELLQRSSLAKEAGDSYVMKEYFPKNLEDIEYPDEFRPHDTDEDNAWEGFEDGE